MNTIKKELQTPIIYALRSCIADMRAHAKKYGPQHAWWEDIFRAETLLKEIGWADPVSSATDETNRLAYERNPRIKREPEVQELPRATDRRAEAIVAFLLARLKGEDKSEAAANLRKELLAEATDKAAATGGIIAVKIPRFIESLEVKNTFDFEAFLKPKLGVPFEAEKPTAASEEGTLPPAKKADRGRITYDIYSRPEYRISTNDLMEAVQREDNCLLGDSMKAKILNALERENDPGLRDRSDAWLAVTALLFELDPDWATGEGTGTQKALQSIRKMCSRSPEDPRAVEVRTRREVDREWENKLAELVPPPASGNGDSPYEHVKNTIEAYKARIDQLERQMNLEPSSIIEVHLRDFKKDDRVAEARLFRESPHHLFELTVDGVDIFTLLRRADAWGRVVRDIDELGGEK